MTMTDVGVEFFQYGLGVFDASLDIDDLPCAGFQFPSQVFDLVPSIIHLTLLIVVLILGALTAFEFPGASSLGGFLFIEFELFGGVLVVQIASNIVEMICSCQKAFLDFIQGVTGWKVVEGILSVGIQGVSKRLVSGSIIDGSRGLTSGRGGGTRSREGTALAS